MLLMSSLVSQDLFRNNSKITISKINFHSKGRDKSIHLWMGGGVGPERGRGEGSSGYYICYSFSEILFDGQRGMILFSFIVFG